jgi:hypothetical protein
MSKLTEQTLEAPEQKVVSQLQELLKMQSMTLTSVRLAELAEVAFRNTFSGRTRGDKLANALARGLSVREKMAVDEGGSMSADETAQHVGLTKQSVLNLYHSGKLLAWRTEKQGALRFPVWQFRERQRLPGLEAILARLNKHGLLDDWGKIGFFLQTHGTLANRRPLDLLRDGKIEPVLKSAEAYAG